MKYKIGDYGITNEDIISPTIPIKKGEFAKIVDITEQGYVLETDKGIEAHNVSDDAFTRIKNLYPISEAKTVKLPLLS